MVLSPFFTILRRRVEKSLKGIFGDRSIDTPHLCKELLEISRGISNKKDSLTYSDDTANEHVLHLICFDNLFLFQREKNTKPLNLFVLFFSKMF